MAELSVLAVFAHPDDETILAGGTLAMLADNGARLHLLFATRGEGGELGEPPLTGRKSLGQVREREARCAADRLGAASVAFMDYRDPPVGADETLHAFTSEIENLADEIAAWASATGAQALLSHGSNGEYGHPAHVLVHRAAKLGLQSHWGSALPLYGVSADFPDHPKPRLANQDDPAHFVLDVSPWMPLKLEAARCHQTQAALFVRRSSEEADRQLSLAEVLIRTESLHRAWPPLEAGNADPLADLLRSRCERSLRLDELRSR